MRADEWEIGCCMKGGPLYVIKAVLLDEISCIVCGMLYGMWFVVWSVSFCMVCLLL